VRINSPWTKLQQFALGGANNPKMATQKQLETSETVITELILLLDRADSVVKRIVATKTGSWETSPRISDLKGSLNIISHSMEVLEDHIPILLGAFYDAVQWIPGVVGDSSAGFARNFLPVLKMALLSLPQLDEGYRLITNYDLVEAFRIHIDLISMAIEVASGFLVK
jgi:hypothetical protein